MHRRLLLGQSLLALLGQEWARELESQWRDREVVRRVLLSAWRATPGVAARRRWGEPGLHVEVGGRSAGGAAPELPTNTGLLQPEVSWWLDAGDLTQPRHRPG